MAETLYDVNDTLTALAATMGVTVSDETLNDLTHRVIGTLRGEVQRDQSKQAATMDPDTVLTQLQRYADVGFIEYVVPTIPAGEEWVVGLPDLGLVKLSHGDAVAFVMGAETVVRTLAKQQGLL